MSKLKTTAILAFCVVLLGVGLAAVQGYQAPPADTARASDELKRALDNLKLAEQEVARLEAVEREKSAREHRDALNYYSALGLSKTVLAQLRSKVTAAEADAKEAAAKLAAGTRRMADIQEEQKKNPDKWDASTIALARAQLKRLEAQAVVADATLQEARLLLEATTKKAAASDAAKERGAFARWADAKGKPGSLEARVEALEKAVDQLRSDLKAMRAAPGKGAGHSEPKGLFRNGLAPAK